jgi:hypothetical protein
MWPSLLDSWQLGSLIYQGPEPVPTAPDRVILHRHHSSVARMTRPARLALEADHLPLCYLALHLIEQNRVIEASYVYGIVQTELAEHRHPN